jgi:hypothetical protein
VKSKGSKKRSPKKKVAKKKPAKKKMVKRAGTKSLRTIKLYICIRQVLGKYVVHPATEHQYQRDVAAASTDVWYFTTTKSIFDFVAAGVFGIYDSYEAAEAAILAVDTGCCNVYDPPSPGGNPQ